MNQEKLLGQVREVLNTVALALIGYGYGTENLWQATSGAIIALIMLVWGAKANEGVDVLKSLLRKVFSGVGGWLIASGIITPEKFELLLGPALAIFAMVWSFANKDEKEPPAIP